MTKFLHNKSIIQTIYRLVHVICVIYGMPTLLISLVGVIIFFHDPSFRINQFAGMIVSVIAGITLLIPVHKIKDEKRLKKIYYLLTVTTVLTGGLLAYPIYAITFVLLLIKFFLTSLRLFAILKMQGQAGVIRTLLFKNAILLVILSLLVTQGMEWLVKAYGRKILPPDDTASSSVQTMTDTSIPVLKLGFEIPGTPSRIWKTGSNPPITIIDTLLPGKGGNYSTLFIHNDQKLIKLAQVSSVEFNDGTYSTGKFGTPVISPDRKYLFIVENGYEGGFTHAFSIQDGKPLSRGSYPSSSGTMHWSDGGKCILGELYEYGDRQALQLGVENGNGYTMYPYEQSVAVAMGIEDLSISWLKEPRCTALLTFTAGIMITPKVAGEYTDQEIIFDMEHGPVKRNRWKPLYNFESSQKPTALLQIYP